MPQWSTWKEGWKTRRDYAVTHWRRAPITPVWVSLEVLQQRGWGSWLGCGYARLWGFLPSGLGVGYSSPQVPRHPTSMCNFGVNEKKIKVIKEYLAEWWILTIDLWLVEILHLLQIFLRISTNKLLMLSIWTFCCCKSKWSITGSPKDKFEK